jgi:hypothetical protein
MAIKRGTLTYGNFVHFNPNGIPSLKMVLETRERDIVACPDRLALWYDSNHLEGIEITSQWLFDLGFFDTIRGQMYIHIPGYQNVLLILKDHRHCDGWTTKIVFGDGGFILPRQKYVHTLQNLFTSLSNGEFLKYNKSNNGVTF